MRISLNLEQPETLRVEKENGLKIYFDFEACPTEEYPNAYTAYFVRVKGYNYPDIVSAIVTERYPKDKMEAIINNFLDTTSDKHEEYAMEFAELQAWRKKAKEIAKIVKYE